MAAYRVAAQHSLRSALYVALVLTLQLCPRQCDALLKEGVWDTPQILSTLRPGYFGLVRVNVSHGTTAERHACALPPVNFEDISRAVLKPEVGLATKDVGVDFTWEHAWHLFQECGGLRVSHAQDGCQWNVKKLLRALFETGTYLMRQGAEPEVAYSLYTHAMNLAWNRVVCVPSDTKELISLPLGYEKVYGMLTSQIAAHLMATNSFGSMQALSPEQQQRIAEMTDRAANWDIAFDVHPSMFPTRQLLPAPAKSISNSTAGEARVLPISTDDESSVVSSATVRAAGYEKVSDEYCRRLPGLWYKREFNPTAYAPLVHKGQHCCASACKTIMMLTRETGGSGGLDTCCQECNARHCSLINKSVVRTLVALVSRVISPTKEFSTPAIYMFCA